MEIDILDSVGYQHNTIAAPIIFANISVSESKNQQRERHTENDPIPFKSDHISLPTHFQEKETNHLYWSKIQLWSEV